MGQGPRDRSQDGPCTKAVHAGEPRVKGENALATPIVQTATFTFANTRELCDYFEHRIERHEYGRYGNPTQEVAEGKIAALENGEKALLVCSGMAAITTALLAMLARGTHMVITDDAYRRTRQFVTQILPRFGIESSTVPAGDYERMDEAIKPNTRVIFSESPTNPYNRVLDLTRLAEIAKRHRVKTIIDSTFATPYNLRPLEFGIDLVIHSATKYLGGHNDLLAGAIVGPAPMVAALREMQGILGAVVGPFAAYLLVRGLKTFPLRIARQNESSQKMAEFLEAHPRVSRVYYPGLESHPDHDVARGQMTGFGGVVSFQVKGDLEAASRVIDACQIPRIAPSLGGVESLIEQPALMSFYELTTEERLQVGIYDNLIRYSVGVEDVADLIDDLARALAAV